tara:strand:- start:13306 stop:14292 length:987 start_codon:yes stop_codon:yes gene_type:complete
MLEQTVCLLCRFKNERHILFEWVHHHLLEGIDKIFLIDHKSDDNFLEVNPWLDVLIKENKLELLKSKSDKQVVDYNYYRKRYQEYDWLICMDMDEFIYSPEKDKTLKDVLNSDFAKDLNLIKIRWKLFRHTEISQPNSIINDNVLTHSSSKDPLSVIGIKNICRTKHLSSVYIHDVKFNREALASPNFKNSKKNLNAFNGIIELNHYRTQSWEYFYGVKEMRGGGVSKNKYKYQPKRHNARKNPNVHFRNLFKKKNVSLLEKRNDLIEIMNKREQVRPKVYLNSSWKRYLLEQKKVHKKDHILKAINNRLNDIQKLEKEAKEAKEAKS